jgi:hypothetical protein
VFIRSSVYNPQTKQEVPATAGVYLYGHWSGTDSPLSVRAALIRAKDRWDDGSYLTRVIFCEMLKRAYSDPAKALDDNLSFGIGLTMQDNEYPITVVDLSTGRVGFSPPPKDYRDAPPVPKLSMSFAECCETSEEDILALFGSAPGWNN